MGEATVSAFAGRMTPDATFTEQVLQALARDADAYRPTPRRPRAAFWRELISALRRDTSAFTGHTVPPAR